MTTENIEKGVEVLKEAFQKYTEKKSYTTRKDVRKALQIIKADAQAMRVWMLEDFNEKNKQ